MLDKGSKGSISSGISGKATRVIKSSEANRERFITLKAKLESCVAKVAELKTLATLDPGKSFAPSDLSSGSVRNKLRS